MFDVKKSKDFLYYLSVLDQQELEKERKVLTGYRKDLPQDYRQVFDYIVGNRKKIEGNAEEIYKELLEVKK